MENNAKKIKIIKIFAIVLIAFAVFTTLAIIHPLLNYENQVQFNAAKGIDTKLKSDIVIDAALISVYFLIGGIGLYMMKKWAMYYISIFGIYKAIFAVMDIVVRTYTGFLDFNSVFFDLLIIIWGIGSIYVLRNRKLFEKAKVSK